MSERCLIIFCLSDSPALFCSQSRLRGVIHWLYLWWFIRTHLVSYLEDLFFASYGWAASTASHLCELFAPEWLPVSFMTLLSKFLQLPVCATQNLGVDTVSPIWTCWWILAGQQILAPNPQLFHSYKLFGYSSFENLSVWVWSKGLALTQLLIKALLKKVRITSAIIV